MFITKKVEVRQTAEKGKGVFAIAEITAGTIVGDYLGIVTESDAGTEYQEGAIYDMWYSDKADICPKTNDIGAHLINTSCEPNCGMTAIGRHTIIFALRKIFPNEEITYDYFMGEQDEECDAGTDNCQCGSHFCRGTMYSNPKAYEAWEGYLEKIMGDQPEEPPVPYGEMLPPLAHYPDSIADDPIYPLWGSRTQPPLVCDESLFGDLTQLRANIRESGRHLSFPQLSVVVEGIPYGGHVILKHLSTS